MAKSLLNWSGCCDFLMDYAARTKPRIKRIARTGTPTLPSPQERVELAVREAIRKLVDQQPPAAKTVR